MHAGCLRHLPACIFLELDCAVMRGLCTRLCISPGACRCLHAHLSRARCLRQGSPQRDESSEGYTAGSRDEPSSNSGCSTDTSSKRKRKAAARAAGQGKKPKPSSAPPKPRKLTREDFLIAVSTPATLPLP